jgi:poly-gamma-glutamate synthesis protein (capsule biosynthesis protein)
MTTVVIGADICPIGRSLSYFKEGDASGLFHDLLEELQQADLTVANLECPMIEEESPIEKTGPVFGVDSGCVKALSAAGIDVVSLANNHIMDHGPMGLSNTLNVCAGAGIATVGAGKNLDEARRMLITDVGGCRIGIIACAEREFSIAADNSWGANPLSVIDFVRNARENHSRYDYLIVLFHGGHEHYPYPSPRIKDTCRFLIEMGANAVFVQHPHRLCGHEEYEGGNIVYGQGALILDELKFRNLEPFHEGVIAKLKIADSLSSTIEFIPFIQSGQETGARKMTPVRADSVLQTLEEKSKAIQNDEFLKENWIKFCRSNKHNYLSTVLGHNRLLDKVVSRGLLGDLLYGQRLRNSTRNVIRCETHREVLDTIFDEKLI